MKIGIIDFLHGDPLSCHGLDQVMADIENCKKANQAILTKATGITRP